MGFSGRSDVIRISTRMLIADNKEKSAMSGDTNSVLTLIHTQDAEDKVTEIKHDYEDIIRTQIHSHFKEHKCLEIFISMLENTPSMRVGMDPTTTYK